MNNVILQTELPDIGVPRRVPRRGKVRDIYDLGEHLLLVVTDRVSAFDVVLPNGIPGKGRVLTSISVFWFRKMEDIIKNHIGESPYIHICLLVQENGRHHQESY
jgi:phosphoribosylaminoimidazole-succinocarboxamide synthase